MHIMNKIQMAARRKTWNDNGNPETSTNYNPFRKIKTRIQIRNDDKNPVVPVSMNRLGSHTQPSADFHQRSKNNEHAAVKHEEENSQVPWTRSGARESNITMKSNPLLLRRRKTCLRHADAETQEYVKPSVDHDANICGAELKLSHIPEPLLDAELPKRLEAASDRILHPNTQPISHEQLVVEVKGIYAGLVMVEAKCINIDERQSAAAQERDPPKSINHKNDQWQSLIALHKQLLHEHHDFFLASQHPSASPALSRLAAKFSMPARMWRHGIHAFLEVLRHRLPESLEHMLAFIYIAYSMMAILYETVPTFEDTWIECLGDLSIYRMAIEDDEPRDREVWSNVARFWYNKAADKRPNVGRLYHHLAILARPYTLEQLSLYTRSLTCVTPFESARGSIMTLFNPLLNNKDTNRSLPFETFFIKAHGLLFTKGPLNTPDHSYPTAIESDVDSLLEQYEQDIVKAGAKLQETGVFAAMSTIASLFEYGGFANMTLPSPRSAFEVGLSDDERSYEPPLMTWPGMEGTLWAGHHNASASQCKYHIKYSTRFKEYVSLARKGFKRKILSLNLPLLVPFIASFLPAVSAGPIGSPDNVDNSSSIALSVPLLAGSLYIVFAAVALAMAHSLAAKNGPIRVWACMMSISAYGWWAVRNDVTASSSLSIAGLSVWAISALQYGKATFQEFKIPERMSLIILLAAVILDLAVVRFMTPKGAPISQSDLLSLSLPAMSLSLAITANLVGCFRSQPPVPPPIPEIEARNSLGDSYREGPFQQPPTIQYLGTSRLRLLGSPLNEDSSRIWDKDD